MSKYKRPFSVNYRKPVVLDSSDPRNKNLERYRSRLGRKVIVKDLPEAKTLEKTFNPFMNIYANVYTESGSIVIDSENNIYLISKDFSEPDYFDSHFITKMDQNGNFIWELRIDDIIDSENEGIGSSELVIDRNNNLYVTIATSIAQPDFTSDTSVGILKLTTDGDVVWTKFLNDPQYRYASANYDRSNPQCLIDSDFNIYLVSNIALNDGGGGSQYRILLMKLDQSGNLIWQKIYLDTLSANGAFFTKIGIDNNNNLYIQIFSDSLLKLDPDGALISIKQIDNIDNTPSNFPAVTDMIVDNESIYLLIYRDFPDDPYPQNYMGIYLLKLDLSFNIIWEKYIGKVNDINDNQVFTKSLNGFIFLTIPVYKKNSPSNYDDVYFSMIKISASGEVVYQKNFSGPIPTEEIPGFQYGVTRCYDIVQKNSSLYCCGETAIMIYDGEYFQYYNAGYILKISSSLSGNSLITFTNAVLLDDDALPRLSYDIKYTIDNISLFSSVDSSIFSISDWTSYTLTSSSFANKIKNLRIEKTTDPELIETKGVFL